MHFRFTLDPEAAMREITQSNSDITKYHDMCVQAIRLSYDNELQCQ